MMNFGWKKEVEKLRMVILSGAHQLAAELPPGLEKTLAAFGAVAKSGDGSGLTGAMAAIDAEHPSDPKPLWEPARVQGWQFWATMYRKDKKLWWLVHAEQVNGRAPSDKERAFLSKILEMLGAEPSRHMIIGPDSTPAGHPPLQFGWWTWVNHEQLYEIQVNKARSGKDMIRVVPLGTRETDGYFSLDEVAAKADDPSDLK